MGETKKQILTRLKNIESKLDALLLRTDLGRIEDNGGLGGMELALKVTGLTRPSIYNLISARQIPHYKKGKRLYFKRKELEDWIESGRRKTQPQISR